MIITIFFPIFPPLFFFLLQIHPFIFQIHRHHHPPSSHIHYHHSFSSPTRIIYILFTFLLFLFSFQPFRLFFVVLFFIFIHFHFSHFFSISNIKLINPQKTMPQLARGMKLERNIFVCNGCLVSIFFVQVCSITVLGFVFFSIISCYLISF